MRVCLNPIGMENTRVFSSIIQTVIMSETEDNSSEIILSLVDSIGTTINIMQHHNNEQKQKKIFSKDLNRFKLYFSTRQVYPNQSFTEHFRMTRTTFETLLHHVVSKGQLIKKNYIPYDVQLLMCLWILATPDSFRSVGKRFGVNKGTVHYVYTNWIAQLVTIAEDMIKWPTEAEINAIKRNIETKSDFPEVCGFIDGTFIHIPAPKNSVKYFNRKKYPSLILQAVCDDELKFIDRYFGEAGSNNDKRVFSRSPLAQKLETDSEGLLGKHGHLLGDGGYTLSDRLLIPYCDNGHLLDEQIHFNNVLSSIRSTIERAFALLKGKWRRLKYLDSYDFIYIRNHTLACCVLHNFLIIKKDESNTSSQDIIVEDIILTRHAYEFPLEGIEERNEKRNQLALYLYEKHYCN